MSIYLFSKNKLRNSFEQTKSTKVFLKDIIKINIKADFAPFCVQFGFFL